MATARSLQHGNAMKSRGPSIASTVFVPVTHPPTWLSNPTRLHELAGGTTSHSAVFTDVCGPRDADDVRTIDRRPRRPDQQVSLGNKRIDFVVPNEQRIYGNTLAPLMHQNIVDKRCASLSFTAGGTPHGDQASITSPVDQPSTLTRTSASLHQVLGGVYRRPKRCDWQGRGADLRTRTIHPSNHEVPAGSLRVH
ncbi:hypothetical protein CCUG62472_00630 [Mycobacteroides salmoniphilum]|nr:hypothetical protein CCUG62472_00630 [Mycobacteroides salmoniphilum]